MYQLILFDMDGTLLDSRKDIAFSTNYTLEALGFPKLSQTVIEDFVGGGLSTLLSRALLASSRLDESKPYVPLQPEDIQKYVQKAAQFFRPHYLEHCMDHSKWYPGVEEMLNKLKTKFDLGILTNKPEEFCSRILEKTNAYSYFKYVRPVIDGKPKKPDPEVVFEMLNKAGVTKEKTLLVGDSEVDGEVAERSGINWVYVSYGFGKAEPFTKTLVKKIDQFSELSFLL